MQRTPLRLLPLAATLLAAVLTAACTHSGRTYPSTSATAAHPLPVITFTSNTIDLAVPLTTAAAKASVAPAPIDSLSCSGTFCMVTAGDIAASVYGPAPASAQALVPQQGGARFAVSCPSPSFCLALAVDGSGWEASWDGQHWHARHAFAAGKLIGLTSQDGLSCQSTTFCVAIVNAGSPGSPTIARYNGTTWQTSVVETAGQRLRQISCASTTFCLALADHGVLLSFTGTQWSTPSVLTAARTGRADYPDSLSCAAGPFCVAVGPRTGSVVESTGGAFAPTSVDPLRGVSPLSCGSAQFCLVRAASGSPRVLLGNQLASAPTAASIAGGALLTCTAERSCVSVAPGGTALDIVRAG